MGIAKLLVEMSDEQSHAVLFLFQSQLRVSPHFCSFQFLVFRLSFSIFPVFSHSQLHLATLLAFVPPSGLLVG